MLYLCDQKELDKKLYMWSYLLIVKRTNLVISRQFGPGARGYIRSKCSRSTQKFQKNKDIFFGKSQKSIPASQKTLKMMFLGHVSNVEWIPHHVSLQLGPNGILDFENPYYG